MQRWRAVLRRAAERLRREQSGQAAIEFVLVSVLVMWVSFEGVFGWMYLTKYDQLRSVQQQYLEVLQTNGEITTTDVQAMDQQLTAYGFNPSLVDYSGSTPFNTMVTRGNPVSLDVGYPVATIVPQFWQMNAQNPQNVGNAWASGTAISEAP